MATTTIEQTAREKLITGTIAAYEQRLAAVDERHDSYHPDCLRRYTSDERRTVRDRIRGARAFLTGKYDRTYCSGLGLNTVEEWRAHYAEDTLRTALHHLVWAEHYAGIRDRESATAADPFRR